MHLGNFLDKLGTEPQMTKEGKHSILPKYEPSISKYNEKGQHCSGIHMQGISNHLGCTLAISQNVREQQQQQERHNKTKIETGTRAQKVTNSVGEWIGKGNISL